MSTEPAAAEGHPGPADTDAPRAGQGAEATGPEETAAEEGAGAPDPADTDDGADADAGAPAAEPTAEGEGVSEAAAEIAAQRELQERIAQRKAAKEGPIAAGGKLSGTAADLLAAVRAVESGERPAAVFSEPAPAPRKVVAEPVRRAPAAAPAGPAEPAAEAVDAVRALLAEGGAPASLAAPAAATLGEGADSALRDDPWQLLRIPGVRPEQADGFARALLGAECGPDDERRGRALTVWLLEQAAVAGHTALDAPLLAEALGKRAVPDPGEAVQSAIAEGDALVFQDALEEPPGGPPAPRRAPRRPQPRTARRTVTKPSGRSGFSSASSGTRWPRRASPTGLPGWSTPFPRTTVRRPSRTGSRPPRRPPVPPPS